MQVQEQFVGNRSVSFTKTLCNEQAGLAAWTPGSGKAFVNAPPGWQHPALALRGESGLGKHNLGGWLSCPGVDRSRGQGAWAPGNRKTVFTLGDSLRTHWRGDVCIL